MLVALIARQQFSGGLTSFFCDLSKGSYHRKMVSCHEKIRIFPWMIKGQQVTTFSLGSRNGHFKVSNQMDPWCFDHSVYRLIIYPFVRFCDWIIKFWTFCSHKIQWSKHSVSMCIGKSIWNPLGMGFHMIKIFIVCTKIRIQSLLSKTVGSEFWYSRGKNFKY